LEDEVRAYAIAVDDYQARATKWKADFGGAPDQRPTPPKPPPVYLQWYFELRRWSGHLLVEGGLLDQPAWTWEMIDLAGKVWEHAQER